MSRPDLGTSSDTATETARERTIRVAKERPMMTLGVTGALGMIIYQIKNFKNRPESLRISNYVIHTRMYAQGFLVLCLGLGATVEVSKFYYKKWFNDPSKTESIGKEELD